MPFDLGIPELPALFQQAVDERRFSMVDMGNDNYVPEVATSHESVFEYGG